MSFQTFQAIFLAALVVAVVLPMPACWRLCRRARLPGWASLLVLIPVVNVLAVYWFAFATGEPERASRPFLTGDSADAIHSAPTHP